MVVYMDKKVNWEQIKTEYITGDIGYRKLAQKHGVPFTTLKYRAAREEWFRARQKHRDNVVTKATRKAEEKQVRLATKELTLLDKIEQHLDRALSDVDQFNRHIVQEGTGKGETITEERIYKKADIRALKEAAQVLAMVEKMKQEREDRANNTGAKVEVRFSDDSSEWSE